MDQESVPRRIQEALKSETAHRRLRMVEWSVISMLGILATAVLMIAASGIL